MIFADFDTPGELCTCRLQQTVGRLHCFFGLILGSRDKGDLVGDADLRYIEQGHKPIEFLTRHLTDSAIRWSTVEK